MLYDFPFSDLMKGGQNWGPAGRINEEQLIVAEHGHVVAFR